MGTRVERRALDNPRLDIRAAAGRAVYACIQGSMSSSARSPKGTENDHKFAKPKDDIQGYPDLSSRNLTKMKLED